MLEAKCLLNVLARAAYLFRVVTATATMDFIRQPCARSHLDAAWRSSTTRSLHSCLASQWVTDMKLSLNWPRCAQFVSALWKAGALNITARMSPVLHAGLKSTSMVHCSGWIRYWFRWVLHTTRFLLSPRWFAASWVDDFPILYYNNFALIYPLY